jgi:hypothetical protein
VPDEIADPEAKPPAHSYPPRGHEKSDEDCQVRRERWFMPILSGASKRQQHCEYGYVPQQSSEAVLPRALAFAGSIHSRLSPIPEFSLRMASGRHGGRRTFHAVHGFITSYRTTFQEPALPCGDLSLPPCLGLLTTAQ